jgi:hypothetical protein
VVKYWFDTRTLLIGRLEGYQVVDFKIIVYIRGVEYSPEFSKSEIEFLKDRFVEHVFQEMVG